METTPVSDQVTGIASCWICEKAKRIADEIKGTISSLTEQDAKKFICEECYPKYSDILGSVIDLREAERLIKERKTRTPSISEPAEGEGHEKMCWMCLDLKSMKQIRGSVISGGQRRNVCKVCAKKICGELSDRPELLTPSYIEEFIGENRHKPDWKIMTAFEKLLRTKQIAAIQLGKEEASEVWGCMRLLAEVLTRRMNTGIPTYHSEEVNWKSLTDDLRPEDRKSKDPGEERTIDGSYCPNCGSSHFTIATNGLICQACSYGFKAKNMIKRKFIAGKEGIVEEKKISKPVASGAKAPGYGSDYRRAMEGGTGETTPSCGPETEWAYRSGP